MQLQSVLLLIENDGNRQVQRNVFTWQISKGLASVLAVVLQYHGEKHLKIPGRRHERYCSQRAAQYSIQKWASNTPSFPTLACDQVKRQPLKPQFPRRLRKFCLSEVSHLWDRCQRGSAVMISSGCSSGETCCPALGFSGATKGAAEQEISALPCRGNQSATYHYFGNICSPNGILVARLVSNLGKNITAGSELTLIWQLQEHFWDSA